MLIGRDLLARQPQTSSLPETGGLKRIWRDDEDDSEAGRGDAVEVGQAMARWRLTLTEVRSAQPAQLADGDWLPDRCHVIVRGRARFSGQFGRRQPDGSTHLLPEEALMLMELGKLNVRLAGMPLSCQQAYQTLLEGPADFRRWLAYARLVRVGYRLVRRTASAAIVAVPQPPPRQFVLDLTARPLRRVHADLPSSSSLNVDSDSAAEMSTAAGSWAEVYVAARLATASAASRAAQAVAFPPGEALCPLVPWPHLLGSPGLSTAEALRRMSVPEIPAGCPEEACECAACRGQLSVDFDVFRPGHRRRRTAAGAAVPDYRLVVTDVDSAPPCPAGVRALQRDGVRLLFAVVDDASVHYQVCSAYCVETIEYRF